MAMVGGAMAGYCATGSVRMDSAAGEHDDDGDDPREDGAVDEEAGHGALPHFATAAGAARRGGRSARLLRLHRRCPGRAFCRPSTMTRSPAASPSLTTHLSPIDCAGLDDARLDLVFGIHHHHRRIARGSRLTAACGTRMALSCMPCVRRARTYMPGSSSPFGIGEHRAQRHAAGVCVDRHFGKRQLALGAIVRCRLPAPAAPARHCRRRAAACRIRDRAAGAAARRWTGSGRHRSGRAAARWPARRPDWR